jgi:hypothetical protein
MFSSPRHCGLDGDQRAGGDRRLTRQGPAKRRTVAGDFLVCARNGGAAVRGRKWADTVEQRSVEAKPSFGQISRLKRPFGAVDPDRADQWGKWKPRCTAKVRQPANNTGQRRPCQGRSAWSRNQPDQRAGRHRMSRKTELPAANPKTSNDGRDYLGLKLNHASFIAHPPIRDPRPEGRELASPPPSGSIRRLSAAAPCRPGSGGAAPANRNSAVTPTAIAPASENAICQPSDGMRCFAIPCVAA